MLAKPGQQGSLLLAFSRDVDHQFAATDGKGRQRGFAGSPALGGVPEGAVADVLGPPSWVSPGDSLKECHQRPAVGALLRVCSRGDVFLDASVGGLGFVFSHGPSTAARRHDPGGAQGAAAGPRRQKKATSTMRVCAGIGAGKRQQAAVLQRRSSAA